MDIGITFFIFKTLCHAGGAFSPCIVSPLHVQEPQATADYIMPIHVELAKQQGNTLLNDYLHQRRDRNAKLETKSHQQ